MRIKSLKLRNTVRMIKERLDALNIFLQTSGKRLQGDERADMLARVTQILRDLDTKVQALDNSTIGENGLKKAIYDVNTLVTRLEAQSGISEAPVASSSASASNSASGSVKSAAPVSAAIPTVRQLLRREPSLTNNAVRQATAQAAKPVVSQKMENNSLYTSVYGEPAPAKGGRRTNRKTKTKSARKTKSKSTRRR